MNALLDDEHFIKKILNEYGAPLFIYDETDLEKQSELVETLSDSVEIFYSMKANPNPFICNFFTRKKFGIEVASGNELKIALMSGFTPDNIFFTAPCKSIEEIELAISNNVFSINVDSIDEINEIAIISEKYDRKVNITFRVYQELEQRSNVGTNMTSKSAQFGLMESEVLNVLSNRLHQNLNFIGLHTFQGSQIYNQDIYSDSWKRLIELAKRIERLGHSISFLGLGGGFGYDVFENKHFDLALFKATLNQMLQEEADFIRGKRLMIETGNFLVSRSGYYISKVQYVKYRGDTTIAILDGGTHHIEGESRISKKFHGNRPFVNISNTHDKTEKVTFVGKLLSPNDIVVFEGDACVEKGDIIVFKNSGAYALTSSRLQFLSHDEPIELALLKNGESLLIRKSIKPLDKYNFEFLHQITMEV